MVLPGKLKPKPFTNSLRGTFGLFTSTGPTQMAYVSARFAVSELSLLKTAREILPREILRIQELMQRDIDDDRVKDEIVPYLRIPANQASARFFPPILVALLPYTKQVLLDFYPRPSLSSSGVFPRIEDKQEGLFYEEREYGAAFSVRIPLTAEEAILDTDAMFHGTELRWNRDAIHLLVLDGQHRLVALKAALGLLDDEELIRGYEQSKLSADEMERLSFSSLPVTIIFPPMLWEQNPVATDLSLVSLFREVFVDVNKNAKAVSKARTILLHERDLISIFTREVIQGCIIESALPKNKAVTSGLPLYSFEWEPAEGAESKISDPRAVSSVAVLNQCIDRVFRGKEDDDTFRTLMDVEEGDKALDPAIKKLPGVPVTVLSTERFARWQRNELISRFRRKWMPSITSLLTDLFPSKAIIEEIETKRLSLLREASSGSLNQVPQHSLEFLLGTRSDQKQIQLIARSNSRRVGRFDPGACALAEKAIEKELFSKHLRQIRSGPFERIFLSNVGQVQLFEFVFWTLKQNVKEGTEIAKLVDAFCVAFNDAFANNADSARLFSASEDWNAPVLARLGTQELIQKHVAALFKMSLGFMKKGATLVSLFPNFASVRGTLRDQAYVSIRENLIVRFQTKLKYTPRITEILNEAERDKELARQALKAAEKAISKLDKFASA